MLRPPESLSRAEFFCDEVRAIFVRFGVMLAVGVVRIADVNPQPGLRTSKHFFRQIMAQKLPVRRNLYYFSTIGAGVIQYPLQKVGPGPRQVYRLPEGPGKCFRA